MLEACERKDVAFVQSDARAYVDGLGPKELDRVFLKEVVHHFADDELASICAGLHKALDGTAAWSSARGRAAMSSTRSSRPRATSGARRSRPRTTLLRPSRKHGFSCRVDVAAYPAVIDREVWLGMMRNRFWSTFAGFSDGELDAGIAEVAAAHPPGPVAFRRSGSCSSWRTPRDLRCA